jgi:hypothetical protein
MKTPAKEESPGKQLEIEIPAEERGSGAATNAAEAAQGGEILHRLVDLPKLTDALYLE